MSLQAGKLRHRVTIEDYVTVADSNGDTVSYWSEVAVGVAAAIEPLSAREFMQAQAMQSNVTARITLRYRAGIKATMRIVHGADMYEISGALPDKDSGREYLTVPVSKLEEA